MSTGITGARYYFTNLALSDYPGQNVVNISTTALKLIKIMQQGNAPPLDIGYKLLLKVYDTSFDYFNQQVFTHLGKALTLECKYKLLDPKLILRGSGYPTYDPVGIFSLLKCEYGYCVTRKMFTDIPPSLHSVHDINLAGDYGRQFNYHGLRCHKFNY